ncbi:hypothetical protein GCM10007886_14320 [Methylobacterium gregans]|nr:hypothetical protein GCM10007886_14320 [Methylobacterium gregans]
MHGDLAAERGERVHVALGLERDQHADLPEALGDLVVHVGRDHALADLELGHAAQRHVLADRGDQALQLVGDGLAGAREVGGLETLERAVTVERDLGGLAGEGLEGVVAGDEVGLGVHLDHRGVAAGGLDGDQTLGGDAAGLLGGLGEALLAQPVDGGLEVTLGLVQRALAVHHARAGLLAELLHHRGSDVGHGRSFRLAPVGAVR